MPPTNLLDVTQPPDTQQANLLGQDLRNLALNFQQRMAFISGTLANRWNPGADIQPANWTGLLYFATDTLQVFQWSGAAWVDVTTSILPNTNVPGSSVGLNGQAAAIGATTFYAIPASKSGIYRASMDIRISATGMGGFIAGFISWNNGIANQNPEVLAVNPFTLGAESGVAITFYAVAGTNIQYSTQFQGVSGAPQYSLNVRLEYLG